MKQNIISWLNCSILLFIVCSCNKHSDHIFKQMNPGKFDLVCIWNTNGFQDTLVSEVTGPHFIGGSTTFRRAPIQNQNSLVIEISTNYTELINVYIDELDIACKINSYQLGKNQLYLSFMGETTNGNISLTRK